MGFGGGGGGALPNHQHTSIPLTGGPLDFANTTIASLSAGSTTFSNGAALQELLIGTPAQALVVNGAGTAPEWVTPAAGGASSVTIGDLANFTTTSVVEVDITNYSLTLPTVSGSGNCFLIYVGTMAMSGAADAYYYALVKDATTVTSTTCEPSTAGYNENFSMNTVVDADGDTLKAVMSVAGGNAGTFKSGSGGIYSSMTAFAV